MRSRVLRTLHVVCADVALIGWLAGWLGCAPHAASFQAAPGGTAVPDGQLGAAAPEQHETAATCSALGAGLTELQRAAAPVDTLRRCLTHPPTCLPCLQAALPGAKEGGEPLPEGLLWLLLTGDVSCAGLGVRLLEAGYIWRALCSGQQLLLVSAQRPLKPANLLCLPFCCFPADPHPCSSECSDRGPAQPLQAARPHLQGGIRVPRGHAPHDTGGWAFVQWYHFEHSWWRLRQSQRFCACFSHPWVHPPTVCGLLGWALQPSLHHATPNPMAHAERHAHPLTPGRSLLPWYWRCSRNPSLRRPMSQASTSPSTGTPSMRTP